MKLVGRPMLAPGICLICERAPQKGDREWIDTGSWFDANVVTYLTGKKHICPTCAHKMALLQGYVTPQEMADFQKQVEVIVEKNKELSERVKAAETIEAAIRKLADAQEDDSAE